MPRFASSKTLLRVATARKNHIDGWKEGLHLQAASGRTLHELLDRVASDRLRFAGALLHDAERLLQASPPLCRASVSRSYYAMYHAMRAAVFVYHGGDDHHEHRALPTQAPKDMNNHHVWANALKDARERRNAADYDPYPKRDQAWRSTAEALLPDARAFIQEVRRYLRTKGVRYL